MDDQRILRTRNACARTVTLLALLFSVSFAAAHTCVEPPSGLVSWWPGDGHAADIVGDNHGRLRNGATFANGMVGQAFSFDGVDDFVSVPHKAQQNIRAALTIDAWVMKKGPCQRLNCIVLMKEDVPAPAESDLRYGLLIFDEGGVAPGRVSLSLNTAIWEDVVISNTVLQDNIWYHVAGTYDGRTAKVYVNGILENSVEKSGPVLPSTGGAIKIGQESAAGEDPEFFNGLIDEVELYSRALSAEEIATLFDAGGAGKCKAELPRHHKVVTLRPLPSEHGVDEAGFPAFSGFGTAVAIRNGTAFVGIPQAIGGSRVAVYSQTATGTGWVRTATLTVPDAPVFGENGFGRAIVWRDGLAVIASHTFLHVFRRINGVWTDVQKLAPPDGGPGAVWTISAMRFENGILLVGSNSHLHESVVYLYELAANGKLVQRTTLRAPDSSVGGFGSDVAVAGNVAVVGARGAVYLFRRRSDGAWVRIQKLVGADTSPVGSFGGAVAIDRNMIMVGAPDHECVDNEEVRGDFCATAGGGPVGPAGAGGAVYGFVPVAGEYVQLFKLRPQADEHANYFAFGRRIAMMGNHIVIDAAAQSSPADSQTDVGARPDGLTFTYRRDGSAVTARARGVTSGYVASDSIGLANNWLLVGTPFDSNNLCQSERLRCFGEASTFDLNRFEK
jgi:hypothetical protein